MRMLKPHSTLKLQELQGSSFIINFEMRFKRGILTIVRVCSMLYFSILIFNDVTVSLLVVMRLSRNRIQTAQG